MHGKHPFFDNGAPSSPTQASTAPDFSQVINAYKSVLNNPQAFYNLPKEVVLKALAQMDELQVNNVIEAYKKSIVLYERSKNAAERYFVENPTAEVMYRLAKDSLATHAGALNQIQTLSQQLGMNDLVNLRPPVIANYENMQEMISVTSQLIAKCTQALALFETARDEKLSPSAYRM